MVFLIFIYNKVNVMCKCNFCGKEFNKYQSLAAHIGHCKAKPDFNEEAYNKRVSKSVSCLKETQKKKGTTPKQLLEHKCVCKRCGKEYVIKVSETDFKKGKYSKYCSRSCANTRTITEETKRKISDGVKNSETYKINNKKAHIKRIYTRLKNDTNNCLEIIDDRLVRHYKCKECGKDFTLLKKRNIGGHNYCSAECKHKYLSEHTGGYRNGSGRGKSGWYKGIKCDSSWELAFVIYHLDKNMKIERCKEVRKYTYKNKEHEYHPDFVTNEGIVEIKGYKTEQWLAKEEQNQDVKVLYKKDIKPYIDYVIEKYGVNFIELYDNSKPTKKNKKYYWVHKNGVNTMILVEKLGEYLENGWVRGQTKKKDIKK